MGSKLLSLPVLQEEILGQLQASEANQPLIAAISVHLFTCLKQLWALKTTWVTAGKAPNPSYINRACTSEVEVLEEFLNLHARYK